MLWFVGLGISGSKSIPVEALEVLSKADIVYLEQFTSPIGKSNVAKIKKMTNNSKWCLCFNSKAGFTVLGML